MPISITGETGTGKELIAKDIHFTSARHAEPFIAVNCSAIPETLMEAEFFGHMQGSFTGAHKSRGGHFQAAHKGTLFLDEIGDLPISMQVKLLRALQEKEVVKVGSSTPLKVDVRILVATSKNLKWEVNLGRFREDLYYRISAVTLRIPPLRERPEDILELAEHFAQDKFKLSLDLSEAEKKALLTHPWPGNVRELEHWVEKFFWLKELDREQCFHWEIVRDMKEPPEGFDLRAQVADLEKTMILKAMEKCSGNKSRAAKLLGISLNKLRYCWQTYKVLF